MQEKMRINKYLSQVGVASRREVDRLIEQGKISVNEKTAESGMKVSSEDKIKVNGKLVGEIEKKVYYLLNKPKGVVSAAKDSREKTVVDLIKCEERIYPIGRLDLDTEGLLILTNDGDLFNRIIHPRSKVYKKYYAELKGEITNSALSKLRDGVHLEDGMTLPAKVKLLNKKSGKSLIEISIREGRNRQIRRMCDNIGFSVLNLKRMELDKISLGNLKVGDYRTLTEKEVKYLKTL